MTCLWTWQIPSPPPHNPCMPCTALTLQHLCYEARNTDGEITEEKIQSSSIISALLLPETWKSGMFQLQGSLKAVSRERATELLFKICTQ